MNLLSVTSSVTTQVAVMFILIMLGYILTKKNLLSSVGTSELSNVLLNVVTPCVLLRAYHVSFDTSKIINLLVGYGICTISHILYIFLSKLYFAPCRDISKKDINEGAAVYSNCGFMAIPLLDACLGNEGVFYGSAYLGVFNIVVWTVGKYNFEKHTASKTKPKIICPGTIGVFIGMFFYLTQLKLPSFAYNAVSFVADLNTPLAMLVLGNFLAKSGIGKSLKDSGVYTVALFKLILAPIIITFVLKLINADTTMSLATVICAACPVATIVPIFVKSCNGNYDYATNLTVATTILSMLTIPLICLVCGYVL